MRILRLNKQDTAGIEERQAAERPPPLSGEAGPERAGPPPVPALPRPLFPARQGRNGRGTGTALVSCAPAPLVLTYHLYGFRIKGVF